MVRENEQLRGTRCVGCSVKSWKRDARSGNYQGKSHVHIIFNIVIFVERIARARAKRSDRELISGRERGPAGPAFPVACSSGTRQIPFRRAANRVCNEYLPASLAAATAARTRTARRESVGRFSRHHAREEKSESCRCMATRARGRRCRRCSSGVWTEFINAYLRRLSRYDATQRHGTCRAC